MVACFVAGDHAARQGDYAMCRTCYEEALLISRELQDKLWISSMLMNLGALLLLEGDPTGARVLSEESLAISRELGVKSQIGWSLIYLGEIAYSQHELVEATALFAEGLLICRELGDPWATDLALRNLASVALEQEDLVLALAYCTEDLIISKETGDGRRVAHCLAILAGIAARDHANARRAAVLVGATEAILEAANATMWFMQRQIYDQAAATARNLLGNEHFAEAQRQGRAMSIEQVVAYALAEGEV
jgi:tetratricopeptide (TPR) repeat protein